MARSRLFNKSKQQITISSHIAYKKQQNICGKLLQKAEKDYLNNLNIKRVTNNKPFWKTVKPCLTDKTLRDKKITLVENEKVASEEKELVKIFNEYFTNTVSNLDIQRC